MQVLGQLFIHFLKILKNMLLLFKIPPCARTGSFFILRILIFTTAACIGTAFCNPGIKLRIHDIEVFGIQMFLDNS